MINPHTTLDSVQQDLITYQRSTDDYVSDYVVSVSHLNDVISGNEITFSTPFDTTKSVTAKVVYYDYQDSVDYAWVGKLEDDNGYLVMLRKPDGIIGYIQTPTELYFIHPLGYEHAILIEKDLAYAEDFHCMMDSIQSPLQAIDICDESFNRCPAVIDVLALITDNALDWLNINFPIISFEFLNQMVTLDLRAVFMEMTYLNCNIALINSGIPEKRFRFRTLIQDLTLTTDIVVDVENLAANDDISDLRNEYKADLVMAFTDQDYTDGFFIFFGRAIDIGPNSDLWAAITEIRFSNAPRFTAAHELSHLLGTRHNRVNNGGNDDTGDCEHGWRFEDQNRVERRTILAASAALVMGPGGRELHFSNPDILINGVASGTATDNNAQVIRNSGCTVAGYKSTPEWAISIYGDEIVCRNEVFLPVCATIFEPGTGFPGTAPYSFTWDYYIDGGLPSIYLGDDECESITLPLTGEMLYIKLTVESDDNQVLTVWKVVTILDPGISPLCPFFKPNLGDDKIGIQMINSAQKTTVVYPNPTTGIINILINEQIELNENSNVSITNLQGKLMFREVIEGGSPNNVYDISDYPSGTYILKVLNGSLVSQYIIIKI